MSKFYGYHLVDNSDQIVYIGQTDNTQRRCDEHARDGKIFKYLKPKQEFFSEQASKDWERLELQKYRAQYGRNPKYNETLHG